MDIGAEIRNGNSSVVGHVQSINSLAKERMLNGLLGSNPEDMDISEWLALAQRPTGLNIPVGMKKAETKTKFLTLLARNIFRTVGAK